MCVGVWKSVWKSFEGVREWWGTGGEDWEGEVERGFGEIEVEVKVRKWVKCIEGPLAKREVRLN